MHKVYFSCEITFITECQTINFTNKRGDFMDKNDASKLPMMAMKDIPTPNENAERITTLVKESGKVIGYKLSSGKTLNKEEGVKLAKQGGIKDVGVAERNGSEYLKSLPDGDEKNNLSNLPSETK